MDTKCLATGEVLSWDKCLACAATGEQACEWDYGLLRSVRDHQARERNGFHVSDVKACLRKGFYTRTQDRQPELPLKSLYVLLGTMTHGILEESDHTIWCEMPLTAQIGKHTLLGRCDVYYPKLGRIVDYKTTRWLSRSKLPYSDHEEQVRIYALMLKKMGLKAETAAIQYIDLSGPTSCRTCRDIMLPENGTYVCPTCGKESPDAHTGGVSYEVELGDLDAVEAEAIRRLDELVESLEADTPPPGEPSALCRFCPFKEICSYA